jgi:hypothetical protein
MKAVLRALPAVVFFFGAALPSLCQQSTDIPGYLNPKTGAFRPKVAVAPSPDATVKLTTYTGTLEFEFTVTVDSTIPSGQKVICEVTTEVVDIPTGGSSENVITEEAATAASLSGKTATCTVKVPYSWALASGPEDQVGVTYRLAIVPTAITSEPDATAVRSSSQQLTPFVVPKSGTTTTKTIEATI